MSTKSADLIKRIASVSNGSGVGVQPVEVPKPVKPVAKAPAPAKPKGSRITSVYLTAEAQELFGVVKRACGRAGVDQPGLSECLRLGLARLADSTPTQDELDSIRADDRRLNP